MIELVTCDILCVWLRHHGRVKNVDQDQEKCDQEGHATRDSVHRHQETNPGNADEHSRGQVAVDQILSRVPLERHLKPCQRKVSQT